MYQDSQPTFLMCGTMESNMEVCLTMTIKHICCHFTYIFIIEHVTKGRYKYYTMLNIFTIELYVSRNKYRKRQNTK